VIGILSYNSQRSALQTATIVEFFPRRLKRKPLLINGWKKRKRISSPWQACLNLAVKIKNVINNFTDLNRAKEELRVHLSPWAGKNQSFLEISIVDNTYGQVLVSTNNNNEGNSYENQPFFINGKENPHIQSISFSPQKQAPTMIISAPVFSADGQALAILAGE
jgi:hypothetical protein